jgi:hypothetical protein
MWKFQSNECDYAARQEIEEPFQMTSNYMQLCRL